MTTLADEAARLRVEHRRENTATGYDTDWRTWSEFCSIKAVDPLAPDRDALLVYASWLAKDRPAGVLAPGSINRRLSGVLAGWREREIAYPARITRDAREWVKGWRLELVRAKRPTGRGQAPYLSKADLRAAVGACPDTLAGTRDRALILVGFALGARRGELAGLDLGDVEAGPMGGYYFHIRISKRGDRRRLVKPAATVWAWEQWSACLPDDGGAAFRTVDRWGNLGGRMSPKSAGAIVTRAARRVDEHSRVTGHSLRAGFATEAHRAKKPDKEIADQAGWSQGSPAMYRYFRAVDEYENNVLEGIGL